MFSVPGVRANRKNEVLQRISDTLAEILVLGYRNTQVLS